MALACLCSSLERDRAKSRYGKFKFQAFIVDHAAREESSQEVETTVSELRTLGKPRSTLVCLKVLTCGGLPVTTLRLEWPFNVRPLDLPDFETQARRLRYRALGTACKDKTLDTLLVAHHANDQAETILQRLASGHRGLGLTGMFRRGFVPECWGMHGINNSGRYDMAVQLLAHHERMTDQNRVIFQPKERHLREFIATRPIIEKGGIRVLRPLLNYSKRQLIDTCEAHSVAWIEDNTNEDAWRTPRNTIRSLLKSGCLPRALQIHSLRRLNMRICSQRTICRKAASAMDREIILLDLRSGVSLVRIPLHLQSPHDAVQKVSQGFKQIVASFFITDLVSSVSPYENINKSSLKVAAKTMFSELKEPDIEVTSTDVETNICFTAGGVSFRRLYWPIQVEGAQADGVKESGEHGELDLDPKFVWSLSRQPFSSSRESLLIPPSVEISQDSHSLRLCRPELRYDLARPWSPWKLWDGRYWIRVLNHTSQNLVVRPLHISDPERIKRHGHRKAWHDLKEVLAKVAPGKIRWTLPVVAETGAEEVGLGRVLVLPTLGQAGWLDVLDDKETRKLEWEVRYKNVSFKNPPLSNAPTPRKIPEYVTSWNA